MKAILLGGGTMRLIADSALLRCNKPLFLDDASRWCIKVCPAVRISRLGFYIKEKFAARYYDSVSAVGVCIPDEWRARPWEAPEAALPRTKSVLSSTERTSTFPICGLR